MIASRVDGIIFVSSVSTENREKYFSQIKKQANKYKNIPLVSIERDLTSVGIDSVYFDGYANARMATQHLIECGCKKIGHITGPTHMEIVKERVKGYKDCLKENNLYLGEEMIAHGDYSHLSGYVAVKQLMEQVPDMDGLFCGNDQMAIGAVSYTHLIFNPTHGFTFSFSLPQIYFLLRQFFLSYKISYKNLSHKICLLYTSRCV